MASKLTSEGCASVAEQLANTRTWMKKVAFRHRAEPDRGLLLEHVAKLESMVQEWLEQEKKRRQP